MLWASRVVVPTSANEHECSKHECSSDSSAHIFMAWAKAVLDVEFFTSLYSAAMIIMCKVSISWEVNLHIACKQPSCAQMYTRASVTPLMTK